MNNNWRKDYFRYKNYFTSIVALYNTKPNLKIYLELILSLTTIIVFSFFAIRPTILTIIELNKEIASKENTIQLLKIKVKDLQTASSVLQTNIEGIRIISQAVPESANQDTLIRQLESMADVNSLKIIGLTTFDIVLIGDDEKKKNTNELVSKDSEELSFTLSLTGDFNEIFSFVKMIENLRRPVKIDIITVNTVTKDDNKEIVMTITGRVPFLKK